MATTQFPGVFVEEASRLPVSITAVDTAVPAFIGYTEKAGTTQPDELLFSPTKISSLLDYERLFGRVPTEALTVSLNTASGTATAGFKNPSRFCLHYSLQLYFANGGGPCYVVSTGDYSAKSIGLARLKKGLLKTAAIDDVTLLLFPDAIHLANAAAYYSLYKLAMEQCVRLGDRMVLLDIWTRKNFGPTDGVQTMRTADIGPTESLKYAAAYFPRLVAQLPVLYDETQTPVRAKGLPSLNGTLADLRTKDQAYYTKAKAAVEAILLTLPAAGAIAGVYAATDRSRGVWKAPANVNLFAVLHPELAIDDAWQDSLNVDAQTGRSVNAIRRFAGRGEAVVWGARTLAGNDNEWRYVPVRRFFNMVEDSVKKGTEAFVFEPNDQNTWAKVRGSVENFLTDQWRAGALMGQTTNQAFYVRVGLGQTMTALDILEGRLIVEIGMAPVRPAEYIVLRICHKMLAGN